VPESFEKHLFITQLLEKQLNNSGCPNQKSCQILHVDGFLKDAETKAFYRNSFCEADNAVWNTCKRFQTKTALNLCPDFVMPDSTFSLDEILDRLEEGQK